MAISQRAAGTWADSGTNGTTQTVTIPGGAVAGDMMICVASIKPYTASPTIDQGWSTLYAASGGTTANGNGLGSQEHAVFYKEHTGSESNPTITWGVTSSPGAAVIVVFQKAANEAWRIENLAAAPVEQAMGTTAFSVNITTTATIRAGCWVFSLVSAGDDSATFTRSTTAIAGAAITWNGNHVEYPATHLSTTTGSDMAADLGYRLVTTGAAAGATITVTATLSAAERAQASIFCLNVATVVSGTFTADAVIKKTITPTPAPTADAVIKKTITGSLTADAVIAKTTTTSFTANAFVQPFFTANAIVFKTVSGSLTANAIVAKTTAASFSANAYFVFGPCLWTTPADTVDISNTPTLAFSPPFTSRHLVFHMQLDKVNTFNSSELLEFRSAVDQTGWEWWDGFGWNPVDATGVQGLGGTEVRYTIQSALTGGLWYRRVRAGEA